MRVLSSSNTLSAMVVVLVVVLGLTACNRSGPAERTIHLRLHSFALSLHPLKMADVESRRVATLMYAGLVAQDEQGNTKPVLAKTWSHSGNEWEFELRSGVTFSNNSPVTVADVVTSLCAAMQPTSPWAWSLASIEHETKPEGGVECKGLTAISSDRVRIREDQSVPWLLDALGGPAGWILPASVEKEGAYGVMPGAGSYKIREIVPDVKVVLEARTKGSPVEPGADLVQFDYLPDDSVAAGRFAAGKLHVLDLVTPQLVEAMTQGGSRKLKYSGTLNQVPWDRIRVAIVNEKALTAKGFDQDKVRAFINTFSAAIDRNRIAELSGGIGEPVKLPFLPIPSSLPELQHPVANISFPKAHLTIITEPDPYSDLIASSLPKKIGNISIDYKGVEKGILINSLVKGGYDIASLLIESPVHSPEFWKSFFTPGSPLVAFGKPITGLERVHVTTASGIQQAATRIAEEGNWIAIVKERHLQAVAPGISGIMFTPSGQANYLFIGMK